MSQPHQDQVHDQVWPACSRISGWPRNAKSSTFCPCHCMARQSKLGHQLIIEQQIIDRPELLNLCQFICYFPVGSSCYILTTDLHFLLSWFQVQQQVVVLVSRTYIYIYNYIVIYNYIYIYYILYYILSYYIIYNYVIIYIYIVLSLYCLVLMLWISEPGFWSFNLLDMLDVWMLGHWIVFKSQQHWNSWGIRGDWIEFGNDAWSACSFACSFACSSSVHEDWREFCLSQAWGKRTGMNLGKL